MTNFGRLSRTQLLMAQALNGAAESMAGAAESMDEANTRFNDRLANIIMPLCGGAVSDGTSVLNTFVPCYWPVSGRRISNNVASNIYNQDVMLLPGQILGFGVHLAVPPGTGFSRAFIIQKNGVDLSTMTFLAAESGFKTASGFPFSFVAGDRLGICQGYQGAGTPADSAASWVLDIRLTP